jgi:molybdopterin-guanine dinucleotide biosynthesis protein B
MRIIGLAGWSGSGKTTLLTKVIPRIVARGLKISTIKHAHHSFDIDRPGKDSHAHRMAGATEVLVGSGSRWAIVHELRGEAEPTLDMLLEKVSPVDLVLVEGYKRGSHPKLEVYRAAVGKPLLYPDDRAIVAIATDEPLPSAPIPVIDLDDIAGVIDILFRYAVPVGSVSAAAT